jgi:hypothetical protein
MTIYHCSWCNKTLGYDGEPLGSGYVLFMCASCANYGKPILSNLWLGTDDSWIRNRGFTIWDTSELLKILAACPSSTYCPQCYQHHP